MKRIGSALAVLVALAIILIALGGLVYGVIEDPAVVGPLAAAAVAIGVAIYQRRWEKSQELERQHRRQMSPTYTELAETVKSIDEFAAKPAEELTFKDANGKERPMGDKYSVIEATTTVE
jgi:hypothetical protein